MGSSLSDSEVIVATKQQWELDPWDEVAVNRAVIGKDAVDPEEQKQQVATIVGNQSGVRSLEIGAGYGRLLPFVNTRFYHSYGVDYSPSLVAKSTTYLRGYHNCRVILNDGKTFPFEDGMFDFVYSFTCFQHMTEYTTIVSNLQEAFRVLRHGKVCRIQTVCGDPAEEGRYDGIVFRDPQMFGLMLHNVGFRNVKSRVDEKKWIWATGEKV
jgi:SAM-dependent methyltransferase